MPKLTPRTGLTIALATLALAPAAAAPAMASTTSTSTGPVAAKTASPSALPSGDAGFAGRRRVCNPWRCWWRPGRATSAAISAPV
jgi:hypothetical protein